MISVCPKWLQRGHHWCFSDTLSEFWACLLIVIACVCLPLSCRLRTLTCFQGQNSVRIPPPFNVCKSDHTGDTSESVCKSAKLPLTEISSRSDTVCLSREWEETVLQLFQWEWLGMFELRCCVLVCRALLCPFVCWLFVYTTH